MRELDRSDIVNHRIVRVLQTPWRRSREHDRWSTCQTYVELSNGVGFELIMLEPLQVLPIFQVELSDLDLITAQLPGGADCNGDLVCEVLTAEQWPTLGLLLSSNSFLIATAYTDGIFGPALFQVGDFYKLEETVTYWGHQPVTIDQKS